jgi:hypothetical protein
MISNTAHCNRCRTPERRWLRGFGWVVGLLALGGCKAGQPDVPVAVIAIAQDAAGASTNPEKDRMWMTVGERRFAITLASTAAARAFAAQLPLTLDMAELNGNEKHADLPQPLPTDASRPGTIHTGDLMLYGSNTAVIFYQTYRSPYSYTRLGRVDDPNELSQALGRGSSRVMFSEH